MTLFRPSSEAAKRREAIRQDRMRLLIERALAPRLARELRRAGKAAARMYKMTNLLEGALIATDSHEERLSKILKPAYKRALTQMGIHVLKELPKGWWPAETKDASNTIDELIAQWIERNSAQRAGEISSTTRDIISRIVLRGTGEGLTGPEIAKEIRVNSIAISPARARTIARTETHSASQAASLEIVSDTDLADDLKKEWVSVEDERVRPDHNEANGQKRPLDEPFSVGGTSLMFPGDPNGTPSQIINCRCAMVYV